ncbi:hypothetical protein [Georgenia wangjunii]|uniref:hypothetical protein n=1 Tax=Georgenia wangjunii TaxID=3117730 RepID=UPI002F26A6A4
MADTQALQAAVDTADLIHLAPNAEYVVASVDFHEGITIDGHGSTVRRPANAPNWTRTFTNENRLPPASADDRAPIRLRNMTIDGNLVEQGPWQGYELEQAMLVSISGNPGGPGRQPFLTENVKVINSPSDGLHLNRNVRATLVNTEGVDCFRGGITVTGGHTIVEIVGYTGSGDVCGAHLDIEIDSAGYGGSKTITVNGTDVADLTPIGVGKSTQISAYGDSRITFTRMTALSGLYVYNREGVTQFIDSEIHVSSAPYTGQMLMPGRTTFRDTTMVVHGHGDEPGTVYGHQITWYPSGWDTHPGVVTYDNVTWEAVGFAPGDVLDAAVRTDSASTDQAARVVVVGGDLGPFARTVAWQTT